MCSCCKNGYTFSFQAVKCLPDSTCQPWHPYLILTFTLIYQVLMMLVLLLFLKLNSGAVGSGYLFGPLFCIAATGALIDFSVCTEENLLSVKDLSSIFLLNPLILGYFKWCFFKNLDNLSHHVFQFLIPVVVVVSVLILVLIAQKCTKCIHIFQQSPLKLICLLVLLSFWSVANTSVSILLPVQTDIGFRVWIQPNRRYFEGLHAVYGAVAFTVLLFIMLPFTALLFLTPFLHGKLSLVRVKPFVDEFYSCYQDKYRWYASVYFFSWIILSFSQFSFTALQTELIAIATLHIILRPYSSIFLNVVDTFLLVILVVLFALTADRCYYVDHDSSVRVLFVMLFFIPYLYFFGGLTYIIFKNIINKFKLQPWVSKFKERLSKWFFKSNEEERMIEIDYSYNDWKSYEERGPSYQELVGTDEGFKLEVA